uniref:Anaphase promoting complex subunit 11 n=1 Tax=Rousettus aegyptiacus TaxID=9407 RepID=A0A7J8G473_ROUAE|nr:anaphase promoting complex subunit 11 [Rousettus aegyptiacus]
MKVKIKCWNGVATWLWVANDENCGICRMAFNGCCPDLSRVRIRTADDQHWPCGHRPKALSVPSTEDVRCK